MTSKAQLDFTAFHNVIDGRLEETDKKGRTTNPSTLEDNPEFPISSRDDVNKAVTVAQKVAKQWAEVPWVERKKALESFTAAFESYSGDFARLLTWEQGKPLLWAKNELDTATRFLKGFCELSLPGETIENSEERKIVTHYLPLGVTVGIVPWNYPIFLACGKMGPALLAGNAFILKSSPFTPYSGLKLAELGTRFFPPGVFQALSGDDSLGPFLTAHPLVNMISFTGSAPTGKEVMKACSQTLKRVSLELGGNDPAIVCADVDPVVAASKIALFAFCNSGQMCMSIKRVYVHSSIYDQFLSTIVKYVESWKYGVDETSFIGPVANKPHFERLKQLLADAEETGLTVATGGLKSLPNQKGFFLPVTIIDNPPDTSAIVELEQFGPVLPLLKWSDETDVIQRANQTNMGLGASVWTRDDAQATRLGNQLHSGNVWINTHAEIMPNTPFGGHKESGIGVEWGEEGLKAYCKIQAMYKRPFE